MGVFKIYVNGKTVADDYLSPGWVDYNKKMPFVRYDITSLLDEQNAIGVVLGDGWAVGHVGSNTTFKRTSYSDQIELSAQINVEYSDGTIEYIKTGKHWKLSVTIFLPSRNCWITMRPHVPNIFAGRPASLTVTGSPSEHLQISM